MNRKMMFFFLHIRDKFKLFLKIKNELRSRFENIVESDKTDVKGHATDSSKEPVKESHAVVMKLPPLVL